MDQRIEPSQVTSLHADIDGSESVREPRFGVIDGNLEMVVELGLESGSGFADDLGYGDNIVVNNNLDDFNEPDDDEIVVERSGLRLVTVDSGSDDDDDDPVDETEIWGIRLEEGDEYVNDDDDDDDDDDDEDDVSVTIPFCWNSVQLDDHGGSPEEFDWEEVDGGSGGVADEREILSTFAEADIDDDDNGISVSLSLEGLAAGEERGAEEGSGNLGWEVLLNAHTLEINFDAENREIYIVGDHNDYIQPTEYETLFEQFAEAGITALRLPPTSNSFVKNLPMVRLDEGAVCAVCKEDMDIGNKAAQLPCNHKYHSECILPWLKVRNTCPVCRHELPTDDTEYEQRKSQRRTTTTTTSDDLVL